MAAVDAARAVKRRAIVVSVPRSARRLLVVASPVDGWQRATTRSRT